MKLKLIICVVLFLTSCESKNSSCCNSEFHSRYFNLITIVNEYRTGNEKISSEYFDLSLRFLQTLTEYKDNVYRGDFFGYPNNTAYYKDLQVWSSWFVNKGSKLSCEEITTMIGQSKILTEEEKSSWPEDFFEIMVNSTK
ncbi:hypothetical protein [Fulvivirga ligni]|uniref:hypothetical protein n=1 Tax=Fulvivirga ligni TaxID=2904246 RepID=UPI001F21289C|nr:hypothetical protein [Fulvivirga ligni]UII21157.1 hypothetical protein LVD16_25305 [Fulvivirga ligni]